MGKKITSVLWSASNLPLGLSFSTVSGTFSGTPRTAGDYTVPVTVKTNYGTDTKNVKISVKNSYQKGDLIKPGWLTKINHPHYSVRDDDKGEYANMINGGKYVFLPNNTNFRIVGTSYYLEEILKWYADYSTLPEEMCFRYVKEVRITNANTLYQVWLDVKNEHTLLPYDLELHDIKLYLVNATRKLYDFIFLDYYNGTNLSKDFSIKGINSTLGWSMNDYLFEDRYRDNWFPIVEDISKAPQEVLAVLNNEGE